MRPVRRNAVAGREPRAVLAAPFIVLIRLYQALLGPFLGGHCRFHPTCSEYAIEAYRIHGPVRGTILTARRLIRCHPLCRGGFDPVPEARDGDEKAAAPGGGRAGTSTGIADSPRGECAH